MSESTGSGGMVPREALIGDTLDFGIDSAQSLLKFVQNAANKGVKVSNQTIDALHKLVDELQEAKSEIV